MVDVSRVPPPTFTNAEFHDIACVLPLSFIDILKIAPSVEFVGAFIVSPVASAVILYWL